MDNETNRTGRSSMPWIIGLVVLAVIAALLLAGRGGNNPAETVTGGAEEGAGATLPVGQVPGPAETGPAQGGQAAPGASDASVKEFTVNGTNFAFDVKEMRVKRGDKVRVEFVNKEGFHDWVLDEFDAKTPQLQAGKSATVEFVADKAGTYEYYCSVGKHREMGMKGVLIVE